MTVSRSVASRGRTPRSMLTPFACAALMLLQGTAAALQFGSYRCSAYNVSGIGGASCRLTPPIVINPDGTYQESSTQGTYKVSGNRIHFSESTVRGPGMIMGQNQSIFHTQIIFEYDYLQRRHTVTYLCQDCNLPDVKPGASGAAAAGAPPVRAEVRLQFARADGFLGWVNFAYLIPREHAAAFAASPLRPSSPPPGAVQGSAGRSDPQTVSTLFRHARVEVDYVVFLESHSQRIAVASLRLPKAPASQPLTVSASFDHGLR